MVRLEHENTEELKERVRSVFGKHLDLSKYKIFFFGSRVAGRGSDRSDIDIGVSGEELVPEDSLARIKDELEESTILYEIDVVDFTRARDRFKQVALQDIEYLE